VLHGFVALLDVLGFSMLVADGGEGSRLDIYLKCITSTLAGRPIDYVVFSDSIVLTTSDDSDQSLAVLIACCSVLFGRMLQNEIALRGAISYGFFIRDSSAGSVFVAGRPVIEAYNFEIIQDWVGIMLAPSVLKRVPDLADRCSFAPLNAQGLDQLRKRMAWVPFVQPCHGIPFHSDNPLVESKFDGFAIVPTLGETSFTALRDALSKSIKSILWLKSIAPNPQAQAKYQSAYIWLANIAHQWQLVTQTKQRIQASRSA